MMLIRPYKLRYNERENNGIIMCFKWQRQMRFTYCVKYKFRQNHLDLKPLALHDNASCRQSGEVKIKAAAMGDLRLFAVLVIKCENLIRFFFS